MGSWSRDAELKTSKFVYSCYDKVNLLPNTHNRCFIALAWGWNMRCIISSKSDLWSTFILMDAVLYSGTSCDDKVYYENSMMTSSNGKHVPCYWPFVQGNHQSRWIPRTKASDVKLWCFILIWAWIYSWVNNCEAGDLRCHHAHYDIIVMLVFWCVHARMHIIFHWEVNWWNCFTHKIVKFYACWTPINFTVLCLLEYNFQTDVQLI